MKQKTINESLRQSIGAIKNQKSKSSTDLIGTLMGLKPAKCGLSREKKIFFLQ